MREPHLARALQYFVHDYIGSMSDCAATTASVPGNPAVSAGSQARLGLQATYGKGQGLRWMVRWRLFYLACSELFAYNGGTEWFVSHYLFTKKA